MGFLDDYFALQQEYESKFGEDTVVFMQKGQFYEIYQVIHSIIGQFPGDRFQIMEYLRSHPDPDSIGCAVDVSFALGLLLTSSNKKKVHSLSNPLMVGVPVAAYEDRRDLLLVKGYTVIRVDEIGKTGKSGQCAPREVAEVVSLGTRLESIPIMDDNTNRVVSIYIQYQKSTATRNTRNSSNIRVKCENFVVIVGMSAIDITTGQNWVAEVYSQSDNEVHAVQEMYRFLASHRPREVIINVDKLPEEDAERYEDYLNKELELSKYCKVLYRVNITNPEYSKLDYQIQFLNKVFNPLSSSGTTGLTIKMTDGSTVSTSSSNLSIVEELDLERYMYGLQAYILLLQYCYDHDEGIITKVDKPITSWADQNTRLVPSYNAINQMNLLPPSDRGSFVRIKRKKLNSLLSVLDCCATKMGSRLLLTTLMRPLTDIDELNKYYDMTDCLVTDEELLKSLRANLQSLPDIDRINRKLSIHMINPNEMYRLITAYTTVINIMNTISQQGPQSALQNLMMSVEETNDFNRCIMLMYRYFNIDNLKNVKLVPGYNKIDIVNDDNEVTDNCNPFNMGVDPAIDQLYANLLLYRQTLQQMCDYLNQFITGSRSKLVTISYNRKIKPSSNDDKPDLGKMICIVTTSTASGKKLKTADIDVNYLGQLSITKKTTSVSYVSSPQIQAYLDAIVTTQEQLEQLLYKKYQQVLTEINQFTSHRAVARFCAIFDYVHNAAWTAIKYKLFRPTINVNANKSFIDIKQMRHLLVERLSSVPYVANDLEVGTDRVKGKIIYGVNATGKTTYTKAAGAAVLTAQAGMFVPGHMTYYPYNSIMTRLSGNDDLLAGKSSFVVEMLELRSILRQADQYTLVLGDELSRGTETESGTAITMAAINWLLECGSSFIFSTHMHHLTDISSFQEMMANGLDVCHLSVVSDPVTKALIYERTMAPGSGSSLYGLEVCRSLAMPQQFLDMADQYRKLVTDTPTEILSTKKSRYNAKIYVDHCTLCGGHIDLQTHHMQEQADADDHGFIGHYHKNEAYNLVVLCKRCHDQLHATKLQMQPEMTTAGTSIRLVAESSS